MHRNFARSGFRMLRASLPEVSLVVCFLSASLSQLAHYATYLRLYP